MSSENSVEDKKIQNQRKFCLNFDVMNLNQSMIRINIVNANIIRFKQNALVIANENFDWFVDVSK